jgi:hypothetical protein
MFTYLSNDAEKVFGIGLSRTGTTSLNKALNLLGLRAFHWRFPPENRILRIEDAYYCDAITDINAAFCFETLSRMFPNAKFVYTSRPLDSWVPSVVKHYDAETPADLKLRMQTFATGEKPAPSLLNHSPLYHAIHHALYTGHASWPEAYMAHDRSVRTFFKDSGRLLEFGLFDHNHGWNELCAFLERKIPTLPYPHERWTKAGL